MCANVTVSSERDGADVTLVFVAMPSDAPRDNVLITASIKRNSFPNESASEDATLLRPN